MKLIIVGVDDAPGTHDALATTRMLVAATSADVLLAHAHPHGPLESLLGPGEHEQLIRGVIEAVKAEAPAGATAMLIADRSPARALQELAVRRSADAIVVGSSHRGPIGRVLPGGVAQRLLSGAPCPIIVAPAAGAKTEPSTLKTVGVAFDGAVEARAAWLAARDIAAAAQATLRVIAVHERIAFGHIPISASTAWVSVNAELRRQLAEDLQAVAESAPEGLPVEPVLLDGDAAAVLADASRELDLLVVGSRGYGPASSVLLGSVSNRLAASAECALMVVPRPPDPGLAVAGEPSPRDLA